MKNECDIVQDLLFSYKDGCLKPGSKEFVEKHLKSCDKCLKIYDEMNKEEDEEISNNNEVDYLKKIKKRMKEKTKIIITISILLFFIILLNIAVFTTYSDRMEIFLDDSITEEERQEIEEVIKDININAEIEYISKEDNLNNLKEKFKDNPDLFAGYEENNIFPASYEVKTDKNSILEIEEKLKNNGKIIKINSHTDNPYLVFFINKIYEPIKEIFNK